MPFEPDIIVTAGDPPEVRLAVVVKSGVADLLIAESQLKRYMFGMGCPTGLLITPGAIRVYRDSFRSYSSDSILPVEPEIPLPEAVRVASQSPRGCEFEMAVKSWLEDLRARFWYKAAEVPELLQEHVIPALIGGEILMGQVHLKRTGTD